MNIYNETTAKPVLLEKTGSITTTESKRSLLLRITTALNIVQVGLFNLKNKPSSGTF
jgi:hypothetical protein